MKFVAVGGIWTNISLGFFANKGRHGERLATGLSPQVMNNLVVEENGKIRRPEDVEIANKIIDLKNTKDKWDVIDFILEVWSERAPEEMEALKIQIEDHRENLTDKEFGQTEGGKDFGRRFTVVFPLELMLLLRGVYAEEELVMDGKFYREFAQRYPGFKIPEKV